MQKSYTNYDNFTPSKLKALLEQSETKLAFFKSAIESISCGFLLIDMDMRITYINKFTKNLFQMNLEGKKIEEVLPPSPMKARILSVLKDDTGDILKGELFPFINDNNETLYFLLTLFPHMIDKKLEGWLLIIQNYTERFHEQILQHRTENLDSMSQVSSNIAHEIKNPLGAMSIHLQLLSKNLKRMDCQASTVSQLESAKDKMLNWINVMEEEIENMNNVIGEFLNSFKNQTVDFKKYDVNEIIQSLINFVKPDIEQRGIEYHLDLYKGNLPISCSYSSISHVILNVVKNAMEEMVDGGKITIKSCLKESRVIIAISDTGGGIPEEKLEMIFSPYMTSKENGTGIGLAISDKIMQTHKGSIVVDPAYKDGARFILDFPAIADEQHLLSAPSSIIEDDIAEPVSHN